MNNKVFSFVFLFFTFTSLNSHSCSIYEPFFESHRYIGEADFKRLFAVYYGKNSNHKCSDLDDDICQKSRDDVYAKYVEQILNLKKRKHLETSVPEHLEPVFCNGRIRG